MSCTYNTVVAEVSVRCNAIVGAVPATLQTNYIVNPLTTTQVSSSIFPLASIRDAILDVEGQLAWAIADCRAHPWRQYISGGTGALLSPDALPNQATGGNNPIIGTWGEVLDIATGTVLSEMPLDEVRRASELINSGFLTVQPYWFNITAGQITHTVPSVEIIVCVYNRETQLTNFNAGLDILLPDALVRAYVAGAVAMLVRDDEFVAQSQIYATYFNNALESIRKGLILVNSIPQLEEVAA